MTEWSVEKQKEFYERFGHNVSDWNIENSDQLKKIKDIVFETTLSGVDKNGGQISFEDRCFLSTIVDIVELL